MVLVYVENSGDMMSGGGVVNGRCGSGNVVVVDMV